MEAEISALTEVIVLNPASNICYIVGAMSLTPSLRP